MNEKERKSLKEFRAIFYRMLHVPFSSYYKENRFGDFVPDQDLYKENMKKIGDQITKCDRLFSCHYKRKTLGVPKFFSEYSKHAYLLSVAHLQKFSKEGGKAEQAMGKYLEAYQSALLRLSSYLELRIKNHGKYGDDIRFLEDLQQSFFSYDGERFFRWVPDYTTRQYLQASMGGYQKNMQAFILNQHYSIIQDVYEAGDVTEDDISDVEDVNIEYMKKKGEFFQTIAAMAPSKALGRLTYEYAQTHHYLSRIETYKKEGFVPVKRKQDGMQYSFTDLAMARHQLLMWTARKMALKEMIYLQCQYEILVGSVSLRKELHDVGRKELDLHAKKVKRFTVQSKNPLELQKQQKRMVSEMVKKVSEYRDILMTRHIRDINAFDRFMMCEENLFQKALQEYNFNAPDVGDQEKEKAARISLPFMLEKRCQKMGIFSKG